MHPITAYAMCCLAFGLPVKNEIAPIAIPMTDNTGRITPVSLLLSPIKLDSRPAKASSGKSANVTAMAIVK
jgi:hypothetical protein